MNIVNQDVDNGKPFDWGRTSADYAQYRDIYPPEFYNKILDRKLCCNGQKILDVGTGTGVLPRNMYKYGGKWTGTDIFKNQIAYAQLLSKGMDIDYFVAGAEDLQFDDNSFDVITACQCFWYFNHEKVMPDFYRMLKKDGSILILYMAWLPFEDNIANASEKLVLKYNPGWSGSGEKMHPIDIPAIYNDKFNLCYHDEFIINIPFTRESWNGRIKACRGVGASLSEKEISMWEKEHNDLLNRIAPKNFDIRHYVAIAQLKKKC